MKSLHLACASLALGLWAGACAEPPPSTLKVPGGLLLQDLPSEQRALLRATLEISGATLPETTVKLSSDASTLSGTFAASNVDAGPRLATLRVYGRFSEDSEEVLLGRATDEISLVEGELNGHDFEDAAFESCDAGIDGACALEFDRNRNGSTNMLDLAPATIEGGRGIDPAEQPTFVNASPSTLQFSSGIRLGTFARQVIVLENTGPHPITFDAIEVGGGQGVALSLFDPFGGPVARPRRSIPAEEINIIVEPGDEFFVAISFAPVNAFLTTAGVQVLARDLVTNVVQATRVKVIANTDGTLRPRPESYVEPDIGASLEVGGGSIPVQAFPAAELFSGQELTTTGLAFTGGQLVVPGENGGSTFTMPADRGFVIDIEPDTRLAVSLSDLKSDIDVAVVELDTQNAMSRVLRSSRHPSTGSEGADVLNEGDASMRVVVVLGRVELAQAAPIVAGGLAVDEPAPFQLICELSRGPEFSDGVPIAPGAGPLEGGTPFTLRGRGFQPGALVTFADFRAIDVVVTTDPLTEETIVTGLMPPGSLEVGKNPATAVVSNPSIELGGDGQAATLPEAFLYDPPAATIEAVLPDVCPTTGCTLPITIIGNFFTNANGPPRINFGELTSSAEFVDSRTLRTTPPVVADDDIVVMTVQNQIERDTFGARSNGVAFRFTTPSGPRPVVTAASPVTGAADGGDTIALLGSGFVAGARVLFGSIEADVLTVEDDAISLVTPAVSVDGPVNISVINPDGQSGRLDDAFTYFFPPPRIDALLPARVPSTGGTLLVVAGASFQAGLTAQFTDGTRTFTPLSVARASSTSALVTTPPLPAGNVTLVLRNSDGQSASSAPIDVFEPQGLPPTIVFVEPATGPVQGRNVVTVAGRDFDPSGVKVFLAGETFTLPVDVGAAAGLDRVQFEAPSSLVAGVQPLIVENGDGQSAVASYLYVELDVARIDQVLPQRLHFLPGAEIQIFGQFFSTFSSQVQVFLGAGDALQLLQIAARSDGLIVARSSQEIRSRGATAVSVVDGSTTISSSTTVVLPTIEAADERGDEIEVLGNDLAGLRLHTLCAANEGYTPSIATDDALVVRRDVTRDSRCPPAVTTPRPIVLVYDNGARSFSTGAVVREQIDLDGDGVGARDDPDDNEACIPNLLASVCDFDKDGVTNATDPAGQDPCIPSTEAARCTRDTDGDGVIDPLDSDNVNACVPNSNALTCSADADNDGVINPFDPADADPCSPNPGSAACTVDSDGDGVTNPFDPVDNNPCIPSTTALNCDADRDGAFPPSDTDNQNPCVPNNQDPFCTDDDDRDGIANAADVDDADPCVPNGEALSCGADDDGDGVTNPFDPADADPCSPNPASPTCVADADGDGVIDSFDPVDDNPCIPNGTASGCDADNDGLFPPADTANTDPCSPNSQHPLCTDDDDRDGVINAVDSDDADACVPNLEALTCAADDDNDGVVNPFDPDDGDPCAPNPAAAACSADADNDGVTDAFDPVDTNACVPNTSATTCDADLDGVFPPADANNADPCVPNANAALCGNDDDRDGTLNPADNDDTNPCIPNSEALTCGADDDNDGVINPFDPEDLDPCAPNPAAAACSADDDGDGVTNPFDPVDNNPCIPNTTASGCDADLDGVFPPTDTNNTDPCVPDPTATLCSANNDDDDRDGVPNAADVDDTDPCIPDNQALTCADDDDNDGIINPFDPDDVDPCAPNPAAVACSADDDGDGVTNPFDPVDNNPCVPNTTASNCDADGDGEFPSTDPDNTDPCTPDDNDPLCTDDLDRDGILNPADPDDGNACIPDSNALTCTNDDDGDGISNPFDPADADPCSPNPASPACTADADGDGVTDPFDPVDDNTCVPNVVAASCDADNDGVFPPTDLANQDPCVPDANSPLCTDDDDRDGVLNPADPDDVDPCIPDSNALLCANDDDGDGLANPFDADDSDPCIPSSGSAACGGGVGGGFRISTFGTSGCLAAIEHNFITGDDHGGLAVSSSGVFYNGDGNMGRFNTSDLGGAVPLPIQEGIVSDLATETTLVLFDTNQGRSLNPSEGFGFVVNALASTDGNGQPNGIRTVLSQPITLGGQNGFFSGANTVGILTDVNGPPQWFVINVTTGVVTDLGVTASLPPERTNCETPHTSGILEQPTPGTFGFLYSTFNRIVRVELPSRRISVVTQFDSLSDMCSFSVLPSLDRWYFHHEGGSQFGGSDESIGFCDVEICGNGLCGPGENAVQCLADCAPSCGNGVCERPSESGGSCPADCDPTCGNALCDESNVRCPTDCTGAIGFCGDGYCSESEPVTCATDCGT